MTTKCRECNAYLARIALYQRRGETVLVRLNEQWLAEHQRQAHGLSAQLFGQRVEVRP